MLLCALMFFALSADAAQRVVFLKNGHSITGELIAERSDKVFVDLGFTILAIPRDEIDRVESPNKDAEQEKDESALFHSAKNRAPMGVKENVDRCGEAVVQVRTPVGLGSGFIIHEDGYLITNDHVIAGEQKITITMYQNTKKGLNKVVFNKVKIVATNPASDLALLKIETDEPRKFQAVPVGDAKQIRQGQTVFAIGSPLGLERSVSQGIVSLKNRPMDGRVYIQTTTQINPGNSGGPLFNLRGEVVGVTNMKLVGAGTEGLGFAIPASAVKGFIHNRDAFAFDPRNPNAGFKYNTPPNPRVKKKKATEDAKDEKQETKKDEK